MTSPSFHTETGSSDLERPVGQLGQYVSSPGNEAYIIIQNLQSAHLLLHVMQETTFLSVNLSDSTKRQTLASSLSASMLKKQYGNLSCKLQQMYYFFVSKNT